MLVIVITLLGCFKMVNHKKNDEKETVPQRSKFWIYTLCVVGFLLFFRIVPSALTIFPKERPTFADTFISVDETIKEYNDADLSSRIAMRDSYIFRKLMKKGIITNEKPKNEDATKKKVAP